MSIQCPHCLAHRIRLEPHRWYEAPLWLLFVQPYRCRRCGCRFLRFRAPDFPNAVHPWRRLAAR
jgi:hypothetical protein